MKRVFNFDKNRTLRTLAAITTAVFLLHLASALTLDRIIEYKQIPFASKNIPPELEGYKIAFITDTHALKSKELENIVTKLNTYEIGLLILGGDFPSSPGAPMRSMAVLSQVITTDGIYGVEGNHDNYKDLFAAMEAFGILPLSNSGLYIRDGFYLAGVKDLWNRKPDIDTALAGSSPEDFILLAAHNPDISMLFDTKSIDLILSGHTHGGQITFFGLWAPALTLSNSITGYGSRFQSGWSISRDGVPVYVSNGTGTFQNVPRVFARPQVIIFNLCAQ